MALHTKSAEQIKQETYEKEMGPIREAFLRAGSSRDEKSINHLIDIIKKNPAMAKMVAEEPINKGTMIPAILESETISAEQMETIGGILISGGGRRRKRKSRRRRRKKSMKKSRKSRGRKRKSRGRKRKSRRKTRRSNRKGGTWEVKFFGVGAKDEW